MMNGPKCTVCGLHLTTKEVRAGLTACKPCGGWKIKGVLARHDLETFGEKGAPKK